MIHIVSPFYFATAKHICTLWRSRLDISLRTVKIIDHIRWDKIYTLVDKRYFNPEDALMFYFRKLRNVFGINFILNIEDIKYPSLQFLSICYF